MSLIRADYNVYAAKDYIDKFIIRHSSGRILMMAGDAAVELYLNPAALAESACKLVGDGDDSTWRPGLTFGFTIKNFYGSVSHIFSLIDLFMIADRSRYFAHGVIGGQNPSLSGPSFTLSKTLTTCRQIFTSAVGCKITYVW